MKNIIKVVILVAFALSAQVVSAQKFARINMQEIVSLMPEFKEMQTNLEKFGKDLQDQLEQIQVEFNTKAQEFQKNQATMAESVKQLKQSELEQIQARYQEFQRVAQEDFQKKQQELMAPIQKKAQDAVEKVAKASGYIAVFDISVPILAYYDATQMVDIATAVKAALAIK